MERPTESLIAEVVGRLESFERNLPRQIDPPALSRSKLPFKALAYREALIWRVTELGRAALENCDRQRYAAAILLTRAVVETTAALWYLSNKLTSALTAKSIGDLDTYLMRLSLGNRYWHDFPDAISVLTFVDVVDETVEGFRRQYDSLSEYAHPNYLGTTGLYSQNDAENILVNFGTNARASGAAESICMVNLSVALMIFEHTYNALSDLMQDFVVLCESNLGKG